MVRHAGPVMILETIGRSGAFDAERLDGFASSVCKVRSETNSYLTAVIQQVEEQKLHDDACRQLQRDNGEKPGAE